MNSKKTIRNLLYISTIVLFLGVLTYMMAAGADEKAHLDSRFPKGASSVELLRFLEQGHFELMRYPAGTWDTSPPTLVVSPSMRTYRDQLSSACDVGICEVLSAHAVDRPLFGAGIVFHRFEYIWLIADGEVRHSINATEKWIINL
ncbi:hypothetical protein [Yoonia sp. SDW83-1]|uniref:hypothetical protein n=1 Tax=Yoonia sp. SDW83-1 TaxID=3366945 RepID=UPI00398C26F1